MKCYPFTLPNKLASFPLIDKFQKTGCVPYIFYPTSLL